MNENQLFRLILLAGFLVLIPIGIYYRLRSRTGEKLDHRQEGWLMLISLRLVGLSGIFGVLLYLINPDWMAWASWNVAIGLRYLGVGFGFASGLLFLWTLHSLGKNLTDTVVTRTGHTLISTGPYR